MGTASTMAVAGRRRWAWRCRARPRSRRSTRAARPRPRRPAARAVELAREGLRPSTILTAEAFDNAITLLAAIGGSTNAVIHLLALAGRVGLELPLERFDELAARTPLIANVRPAGEHLFEQLFDAGGVPAVLRELAPLLAPRRADRHRQDRRRDVARRPRADGT